MGERKVKKRKWRECNRRKRWKRKNGEERDEIQCDGGERERWGGRNEVRDGGEREVRKRKK